MARLRRSWAWLLLFLGLTFFFTSVQPIVLWDTDDWGNFAGVRAPFPKWGIWNPIKVLPEILLPAAGHFAGWFVAPFMERYVESLTLVSAVTVSVFITGFFGLLFAVARQKLEMTPAGARIVTAGFFLASFLLFRSSSYGSTFLFWSPNLTCYYHYVIPSVLNASAVLYLWLRNDEIAGGKVSVTKGGACLVLFYCCVFSNIFCSAILAIYIAMRLLSGFARNLRQQRISARGVTSFIRNNWVYVIVLLLWLVSLVFEANGGRSHQIGRALTELPLRETVVNVFVHGAFAVNKYLALLIALLILSAAFCMAKARDTFPFRMLGFWAACTVLCFIYTVLVLAKSGKIGGGDAVMLIFGCVFFGLMIVFTYAAWALKTYTRARVVIPFLFLILISRFGDVNQYAHSTVQRVDPETCLAVDDFIIGQIESAVRVGATTADVRIPKWNSSDNWPHALYANKSIVTTLKAHGVIDRDVEIRLVPDLEVNRRFGLIR